MSPLRNLAIILLFFAAASAAEAHGLYARAELRDHQLMIEAWFDDDTPAEKAKVKIISSGTIFREGFTNEKGIWLIEPLPAGTYQIQVDAGAGHRREIEFVMPDGDTKISSGPTKNEVWWREKAGILIGFLILTLLVIAGKRFFHRLTHS
jgi:hypothetical protein